MPSGIISGIAGYRTVQPGDEPLGIATALTRVLLGDRRSTCLEEVELLRVRLTGQSLAVLLLVLKARRRKDFSVA